MAIFLTIKIDVSQSLLTAVAETSHLLFRKFWQKMSSTGHSLPGGGAVGEGYAFKKFLYVLNLRKLSLNSLPLVYSMYCLYEELILEIAITWPPKICVP